MWKRILSVFLCTVLCACLFSACSKEEVNITLPVGSIPSSADPAISDSTASSTIAANCYEGLVRVDENGNVQPACADHWSISDDGLTYTFILKDGLTWHVPDAESEDAAKANPLGADYILGFSNALTADDFVFGLQRAVANNTNAPGASRLFGIVNAWSIHNGDAKQSDLGVSAIDDLTVRIKLSAPDSNFLYALASPCAMPCSRIFFKKTAGRYALTPHLMLCNGPYYLSDMSSDGTSITMTKNEDYKGSYGGTVDSCTLVYGEESVSADSTAVDILTDLTSDEPRLDAAILSSSAAASLPKAYEVTEYSDIINALVFNMGSDFSGNEDLRRALTTATDIASFVPEGQRAAEGIVPDCCSSVSGTMYRLAAGKAKGHTFDLTQAKQYYADAQEKFEAAATKDDPAPTSFAITFLCLEADKTLAQSIVQNWQKVFGTNLSITVETRESEAALQRSLAAGSYDVAYVPMHCSELTATGVLRQFAGETDANIMHLASDEYDALIYGASAATAEEDVTGYCLTAEQYLIENGIVLPVSQQSTALAVSKKTAGGLNVLPTGDTYLVYLAE